MEKLYIVYEDTDMMVCYKRAGLPVQSSRVGQMDLESLAAGYVRKEKNPYTAVINRLDQPVEGLVLFARNKKAAAKLSEQIKTHRAGKYYLAVSEGCFEQEKGRLEDYLVKDGKTHSAAVTDSSDKQGKKAVLEYEVLHTLGGRQLVRIRLLTGRYHQIRVQLAHAGHPIIGDMRYNPEYIGKDGGIFPALCAYKLVVDHPGTGEPKTFQHVPQSSFFSDFLTEEIHSKL